MLWLYIDKSQLQGIPQSFYSNYPKNSLSWDFSISIQNMVSYDLLLFMLKIEATTLGTNSMPFLVFQQDHMRSTSGIICSSRSFAALYSSVTTHFCDRLVFTGYSCKFEVLNQHLCFSEILDCKKIRETSLGLMENMLFLSRTSKQFEVLNQQYSKEQDDFVNRVTAL